MVSRSVDNFIEQKKVDESAPNSLPNIGASIESAVIRPKPSAAIRVWLAVVAMVLGTLWWQTQTPTASLNFLIEGNNDSEGAEVRLDGSSAGTLARADQSSVKMVALRCNVSDGKHTIEVLKPGFSPFKETVNVHGAEYVNVRLTAK